MSSKYEKLIQTDIKTNEYYPLELRTAGELIMNLGLIIIVNGKFRFILGKLYAIGGMGRNLVFLNELGNILHTNFKNQIQEYVI